MIKEKNFDFELPPALECAKPSEERGIGRDEVQLLVSNRKDDSIIHSQFKEIGQFFQEGDVLVVNTSGTLNAALEVDLANGRKGRVHISTKVEEELFLVEVRQIIGNETKRYFNLKVGQTISLADGGKMELIAPYYRETAKQTHIQLWRVAFDLPTNMESYLAKNGLPIKYVNVDEIYPNEYYQTCFANEMGSSEMPSAGRAFTADIVADLVAKGVQIAPILLHTGISSLEVNEKPYPEYFRVSETTARLLNTAKADGRRIIAVGTTAIRAIESAIDKNGAVQAQKGMTNLFITPDRGLKVINALLTGFHEPKASHLLMMEALASKEHLSSCYEEAIRENYHWHEFGDLHLLT